MLNLSVLAVGNPNLEDDLWGVKMAQKIKDEFKTIYCGTVPENFLSKVDDADIVVLLDSYNGDDFVLTDEISQCESISTHTYNLNIFAEFLRLKKKEFYFLGVGKRADEEKIRAILRHLQSHRASDHHSH